LDQAKEDGGFGLVEDQAEDLPTRRGPRVTAQGAEVDPLDLRQAPERGLAAGDALNAGIREDEQGKSAAKEFVNEAVGLRGLGGGGQGRSYRSPNGMAPG
jgi:hypothetical protein